MAKFLKKQQILGLRQRPVTIFWPLLTRKLMRSKYLNDFRPELQTSAIIFAVILFYSGSIKRFENRRDSAAAPYETRGPKGKKLYLDI